MLIIIFLKIIRILYLLIMFAFCFRDQVFAKMLEMLSSLPAAKLLESNFEEVLRRGARTILLEIRIHKCAVYWVHAVWRYVQDLVLQVILLIYTKKKDKMCSFKCITSLIEIYKRHYNFPCNIDVIIFI